MRFLRFIFSFFFLLYFLIGTQVSMAQLVIKGAFYNGTSLYVSDDLQVNSSGTFILAGNCMIKSGISNRGIFTGDNSKAKLFLTGDDQSISSVRPLTISNIYVDNNETVIDADLLITGSVEFKKGHLKTTDSQYKFILGEDAMISGVSDHGHFIGQVQKNKVADFLFPVGDGIALRPIELWSEDEVPATVKCLYSGMKSNTIFPHAKKSSEIAFIDKKEFWYLTSDGAEANTFVSIPLDAVFTSDEIRSIDPDDLTIVRWDQDAELWVNQGGVYDASSKSITTLFELHGFGYFSLAALTKERPRLISNIFIYNYLTPNGDGKNDSLFINGIELLEKTSFKVFDTSGTLVFHVNGYDNQNNSFQGFANQKGSARLPTGNYYYLFTFILDGKSYRITDFLFIQ